MTPALQFQLAGEPAEGWVHESGHAGQGICALAAALCYRRRIILVPECCMAHAVACFADLIPEPSS